MHFQYLFFLDDWWQHDLDRERQRVETRILVAFDATKPPLINVCMDWDSLNDLKKSKMHIFNKFCEGSSYIKAYVGVQEKLVWYNKHDAYDKYITLVQLRTQRTFQHHISSTPHVMVSLITSLRP
jgi:hypothetical protein